MTRERQRARTCPRTLRVLVLTGLTTLAGAACGGRPTEPSATQRLVDLYAPEMVSGQAAAGAPLPRTEWKFGTASAAASGTDAAAWKALHEIAGLAERGAVLAGRSTGALPIFEIERTEGLSNGDLLHAVEIRMRATAGRNMSVSWSRDEKLNLQPILDRARAFPWENKTPIVAGDQMRSYVIRPPRRPPRSADIRHLMLNPTDAEGATFEIESVRLIFRKEYLAGKTSGVSWEGLSEVYRETLVARSPETIQFDLTLPASPWLDLGLGTIENEPLTFRVSLAASGASQPEVILRRTLTTPYRWERERVDLTRWAGRKVAFSLTLEAQNPGLLGFWGSPAVRAGAEAVAGKAPARQVLARPARNVIVIMADTLRSDHLDAYGYARQTAPTLTAMASRGALFSRCVTQATWTKVATPTLMTSLYPSTHGVAEFSDRLSASARTLAESYREAGAATLSLCSIPFTGKFTNLHQGFEELHEDTSLSDQDSSKTAREYVDRLLPWLDLHKDSPFFVYLHVSDPHDPFRPAPPYDTLWGDASYFEQHAEETERVKPFIVAPLLRQFEMPSRAELLKAGIDADRYVKLNVDWYDGSIRGMDAEIARLVEKLRGLGLEDDTLVAFVGDHGEEFFEHGRSFHGQTVYGELANVPLILWGAGVPQGRRIEQTVSLLDVMPTLLEISGLQPPEGMQGHSLVPVMGDAASAPDQAIVERAATNEPTGAPPPVDSESHAILVGDWKLIHNSRGSEGKPEFELYALGTDPLDRHDVAAQHPDVVARLSAALKDWRGRALAARLKPEADTQGLSAEDLERLRSLGYVQ